MNCSILKPVIGCQPARKSSGFTLVELLVVLGVIAVLAALLFPVLIKGRTSAQRVQCVNNLRQMGLAGHQYWDDNEGNCFRWYYTSTNDGSVYWFGWIKAYPWPEGQRPFDLSQGVLYPYLNVSEVRLCPSLDYLAPEFKYKASGAVCSYGYNLYLSASLSKPPWRSLKIPHPADTAFFADAAQINDFEDPATPDNPMLEEWYYVDANTSTPNGHFRHNLRANVVFCDGHVDREKPEPGSMDTRLPNCNVGRLRTEILQLQ